MRIATLLLLAALLPLGAVVLVDAGLLPLLLPAAAALAGMPAATARLLLLGAVALAATAAAAALGRPLARALRAVQEACEALGGGNSAQRVRVRGGGEPARIARAFNAMASRLAQSSDRMLSVHEVDELVVDVLSHDVRNQVAAVLPRLEMLARERPELRDELAKATGPLDSAVGIVEDALLLLRLQGGNDGAGAQQDVVPLVKAAVAAMGPTAEAKSVKLRLAVQGMATGWASPLLSRAVENLLSNAVKWSPPRAEVEARVSPTIRGLQIAVVDHGPGIHADKKARLFQRFERLGEDRAAGHGLGLAIAQRIVEMHGGSIFVEDTGGGGATFTVDLPRMVNTVDPSRRRGFRAPLAQEAPAR